MMTVAMILLSAAFLASTFAQTPADPAGFLRETYQLTEYESASADLNGDGTDEIVVRATSVERCGSGGCALFVLSPDGAGFRVVMRATVTHPPIRVLESSTNGWKDLAVTVAGGGVTQPYEVRLRFDGRRYPGNPSVPPAEPLTEPVAGRTLIPAIMEIPAP